MKNLILLLIFFTAFSTACNDSGRDTSINSSFLISPSTASRYTLQDTDYTINYTLSGSQVSTCDSDIVSNSHCEAVIYIGTINDKSYVGIALTDNTGDLNTFNPPSSSYFNLKMYFVLGPSESTTEIPTGERLITTLDSEIVITIDGTEYRFSKGNDTDGLTLDIAAVVDNKYCFTIKSKVSETAELSDGLTIDSISITAIKVP